MKLEVEKVGNGYWLTIHNDAGEFVGKYVAGNEYALMKLIISAIGYSITQLLEDRPAFAKNYDKLDA